MAPRVSFYVVQHGDPGQRLAIVARLADKALRQGYRIHIHAGDEGQARALDDLLWTFRPASFVPHALAGEPGDQPVSIGWQGAPADERDLLINLQPGVPGFFQQFQRVAEVVTQDPASLEAQRAAWRFYRQQGCELEKHDLRGV
ncbi:MAG: DNA polymerase III subunit chi [Haliea sp.]|nr:DNA polymerase III subunit chi [Haliea sp.]|tara:strand:- start:4017 stop:4448 length:432 start_codon:yes stop_codon:yes gene_type:complete